MTKTHEEIVAINAAWFARITDIREQYKPDEKAADAFQLQVMIAIATYVLRSGLTPETAGTFIEEQIDEFQERSAKTSRYRKQHFRDRNREVARKLFAAPRAKPEPTP